jgi:hypothetical protein
MLAPLATCTQASVPWPTGGAHTVSAELPASAELVLVPPHADAPKAKSNDMRTHLSVAAIVMAAPLCRREIAHFQPARPAIGMSIGMRREVEVELDLAPSADVDHDRP